MAEKTKEGLQRGLKERHIQLMAIGTAIGVGLFLGSSPAIQLTGPSIILGYMVCGLIVFIVMRALGEFPYIIRFPGPLPAMPGTISVLGPDLWLRGIICT